MSSYLSIYIKPKESEKKILLWSFSRSSDIYSFFSENSLTGYAYSGSLMPQSEEEKFFQLSSEQFIYALSQLKDEINSAQKKLYLMKELKSKSDLQDIISFQEYIEEKIQLLYNLDMIDILLEQSTYEYSDIEGIYTNVS